KRDRRKRIVRDSTNTRPLNVRLIPPREGVSPPFFPCEAAPSGYLDFDPTSAVPKTVLMHAKLIEHPQEQVGHRRVCRHHDMTVSFHSSRRPSDQHNR